MIDRNAMQLDTSAWRFQVWVAFCLALATTTWGIWFLPVSPFTEAKAERMLREYGEGA